MATPPLPKGYEDYTPVPQAAPPPLPKGYEDYKPVGQEESTGDYWKNVAHNLLPSAKGVAKNSMSAISQFGKAPTDNPTNIQGEHAIVNPIDGALQMFNNAKEILSLGDSSFKDRFEKDPMGSIVYPLMLLKSIYDAGGSGAQAAVNAVKKPGTPQIIAGAGGLAAGAGALAGGSPKWGMGLMAGGVTGLAKGLGLRSAAAAEEAANAARTEFNLTPNINPQGSFKPMTASAERIMRTGADSVDIAPRPMIPGPGPDLPPGSPSPFKPTDPTVGVVPENYRPPVQQSASAASVNSGQGLSNTTAPPTLPGEQPLIGPIPESRATPPEDYRGPNQAPIAQLANGDVGISDVRQPPRLTPGLPSLAPAELDAAEAAYKPTDWGARFKQAEAAGAVPKVNVTGMPDIMGRPFSEADPTTQAFVQAQMAREAQTAAVKAQVQQVFSQGKADAATPAARAVPNTPPPDPGPLTWQMPKNPEGRPSTMMKGYAYDPQKGILHLDLNSSGPISVPHTPEQFAALEAAPDTSAHVRKNVFPTIRKNRAVPTQYEIIKDALPGGGGGQ